MLTDEQVASVREAAIATYAEAIRHLDLIPRPATDVDVEVDASEPARLPGEARGWVTMRDRRGVIMRLRWLRLATGDLVMKLFEHDGGLALEIAMGGPDVLLVDEDGRAVEARIVQRDD